MIIGLCGFQSAGKDTIADYLIKEHGFIRITFASAVKDIISIIFGWPRIKLEGLTKEDRAWREEIDYWWSKTLNIPNLSPRFVMQYIATDLFRNHFHPDIWVKIVENEINKYLENNINKNIVISDCRFTNEINMILRLGGKIIQVHRNPPNWFFKYRQGFDVEEVNNYHTSEIDWVRNYKDYDIFNNESKEKLYVNLRIIVKDLNI